MKKTNQTKKTYKPYMFGIAALLLAGIAAAGVFAMPFGIGKMNSGMGQGNDAIREAIGNGDYSAYMAAIEDNWNNFKSEMTEEQFNKMVSMHKQMQDNMTAMREARETNRNVIQAAIDAGDYSAWKEAVKNSPMESRFSGLITEDNFSRFVEMHKAMKSGDFETAKTIADELGIEQQFGRGSRMKAGCGFNDRRMQMAVQGGN